MPRSTYPCCGFTEYTSAIGAARKPTCPNCGADWRGEQA